MLLNILCGLAIIALAIISAILVFVLIYSYQKIMSNQTKQPEKLYLLRMGRNGKLQIKPYHGNIGYWKDYPK